MDKKSYVATVQNICPHGSHGPYAVATNDELRFITFSLNVPVWQEKIQPECGSVVVLSEIHKKRAGWRANNARFFEPSDEVANKKPETQNPEKK